MKRKNRLILRLFAPLGAVIAVLAPCATISAGASQGLTPPVLVQPKDFMADGQDGAAASDPAGRESADVSEPAQPSGEGTPLPVTEPDGTAPDGAASGDTQGGGAQEPSGIPGNGAQGSPADQSGADAQGGMPSGAPVREAGEFVHEESFPNDAVLSGLFAEHTFYFSAEEDWVVRDARLTLDILCGQLIDTQLSSLTFSLNGSPFSSTLLAAGPGQVEILLPLEQIKDGSNALRIEAYLRTSSPLPCTDDVSPSDWVRLGGDSAVSLLYTAQPTVETIAQFYSAARSIAAAENGQSILLFPSNADDAVLSAAALARAGLSAGAPMGEGWAFAASGRIPAGKRYAVYVSPASALPAQLAGLLDGTALARAQSGPCLMLLKTGTAYILLVTGPQAQDVMRAAQLLGHTDLMDQLVTPVKVVGASEEIVMPHVQPQALYTLTQEGQYMRGAFRQRADFYLNFPVGRAIAPSSELYLSMRYAENLDFDRSLVTVYLNDTPVGSKKLSKDGAQGDTLTLSIPTDLEISRSFTLSVAFDLEIKDLWCTLRQGEAPWAYISPESMLRLNSQDVPYLLFEYFPSPFVRDGALNDVAFVLPDTPRAADYQVLGQLCGMLGSFLTDNSGTLRVARASAAGDLRGSQVIAIGIFRDNAFIQGQNSALFFQFDAEGKTLLSNEKKQIDAAYGARLGTAQLLYLPGGQDNETLLIISGAGEEGLLDAAGYLSTDQELWKIYGDGYVSDGEGIYPFRFKEDNRKKPKLLDETLRRGDMQMLLATAAGVLVLCILSVILLAMKYRKGGRGHEQENKR